MSCRELILAPSRRNVSKVSKGNVRQYNKKIWTVENVKITFDNDEWNSLIDDKGSFIRGVSNSGFVVELQKFRPKCDYKCCNKYSGSSTWTILFICKNCSSELKFSARMTKTFTLFSSGTAQCS